MSEDVIEIHEPQTGASARILATLGWNCFAYRAPLGGEMREVLWAEPGFEQGDKRPSGSGIPILFPFPGRIAGTEFVWEGRSYPQEAGDGRGNAIHGFVHKRAWRVIERTPSRAIAALSAVMWTRRSLLSALSEA